MLYALSDIHGSLNELYRVMAHVELTGDGRLVLLGDYIDYGERSGQVLRFIYELQHEHGADHVIALKGDHEYAFVSWLNGDSPDWFADDRDSGFITLKTLLSEYQTETISKLAGKDMEKASGEARIMLDYENRRLMDWLKALPLFFETEDLIFAHAGIDEEAEDEWKWGTLDETFVSKYPPSRGSFLKTIVAGHNATSGEFLHADPENHGVFYDGASHFYIDGSVYREGGCLNLLMFHENAKRFYCLDASGNISEIKIFS